MSAGFSDSSINAITAILKQCLDGLYEGDLNKFDKAFYPESRLHSTNGETITDQPRKQIFEVIRGRESPQAQGLKRHDRIVSIHKAGPNNALATVECAMPPRYFTDYLTLMRDAGGWRIISKSFHTDVHESATTDANHVVRPLLKPPTYV